MIIYKTHNTNESEIATKAIKSQLLITKTQQKWRLSIYE